MCSRDEEQRNNTATQKAICIRENKRTMEVQFVIHHTVMCPGAAPVQEVINADERFELRLFAGVDETDTSFTDLIKIRVGTLT